MTGRQNEDCTSDAEVYVYLVIHAVGDQEGVVRVFASEESAEAWIKDTDNRPAFMRLHIEEMILRG